MYSNLTMKTAKINISRRFSGVFLVSLKYQFLVTDLFLYLLKTSENLWFSDVGFLMFSGGTERDQYHEMS